MLVTLQLLPIYHVPGRVYIQKDRGARTDRKPDRFTAEPSEHGTLEKKSAKLFNGIWLVQLQLSTYATPNSILVFTDTEYIKGYVTFTNGQVCKRQLLELTWYTHQDI